MAIVELNDGQRRSMCHDLHSSSHVLIEQVQDDDDGEPTERVGELLFRYSTSQCRAGQHTGQTTENKQSHDPEVNGPRINERMTWLMLRPKIRPSLCLFLYQFRYAG